MSLLFPDDLM